MTYSIKMIRATKETKRGVLKTSQCFLGKTLGENLHLIKQKGRKGGAQNLCARLDWFLQTCLLVPEKGSRKGSFPWDGLSAFFRYNYKRVTVWQFCCLLACLQTKCL